MMEEGESFSRLRGTQADPEGQWPHDPDGIPLHHGRGFDLMSGPSTLRNVLTHWVIKFVP